jgi:class 3 adenylate cyclase/HAMP domain-containing protein
MTATSGAGVDRDSRTIIRRYHFAMAVPFGIDVLTSAVYAAINARPLSLVPLAAVSVVFLLLGVGIGAWQLFRPIERFLEGDGDFASVEPAITNLPRRSATLVAFLFGPMLLIRLLAARYEYTFGATIEVSAPIDAICSFLVATGFNFVLTFFVISAYLDGLCDYLFETRGVNISAFPGAFRHKVGLAVLFASFAGMILLAGDIASYEGTRLLREASVDFTASVAAAATTYYWISRALTRPIGRLDRGMGKVADGDLDVRLPVTSDDEVGRAISGFNQMIDGLAERQYLRDTFGKYMPESVAEQILDDQERRGRAADTQAEATVMFIDIEGFTTLSERLPPADVASILNTYLGVVVPVIQRHDGVVNSFIGDGLFVSFNLPLALDQHAAAAIRAALEIQKLVDATTFASGTRIRVRVGINTGPVVAVTIGTEKTMSYTLLGDAVNVASRIEQLNKRFGSSILATESTVQAAGPGFPCVRLGETDVRGHRGEVVVYRIDPA